MTSAPRIEKSQGVCLHGTLPATFGINRNSRGRKSAPGLGCRGAYGEREVVVVGGRPEGRPYEYFERSLGPLRSLGMTGGGPTRVGRRWRLRWHRLRGGWRWRGCRCAVRRGPSLWQDQHRGERCCASRCRRGRKRGRALRERNRSRLFHNHLH